MAALHAGSWQTLQGPRPRQALGVPSPPPLPVLPCLQGNRGLADKGVSPQRAPSRLMRNEAALRKGPASRVTEKAKQSEEHGLTPARPWAGPTCLWPCSFLRLLWFDRQHLALGAPTL